MVKTLFVSGTDTGVGKTTVSVGLVAALRQRGLRVRALKPAESGCEPTPAGGLRPPDAESLAAAAGHSVDEAIVFRLRAPLAPAAAAAREGLRIELEPILDRVATLRRERPDILVVEGAGGLLVPLTDDALMVDLAARLDATLLLVARDGLGTINHSLLSLEAARRRGLPIAGVVLNAVIPGTSDVDAAENAATIARLGGTTVLGRVPHATSLAADELGALVSRAVDLDGLLATLT